MHDLHRLYVELCLISVSIFSADVVSSVRILQSTLIMIIVTKDLLMEGYHKYSCFWEDFARLYLCFRCYFIEIRCF